VWLLSLVASTAKQQRNCINGRNEKATEIWYRLHIHQYIKVKVKCTLVQALRLCTGRTAYRGSRGIALPFHSHGTRRGEGSASRPSRFLPSGKTRYPLYRRLGGTQGRSGQVGIISPHRNSNPDRPAHSQSLYRLRYPAHTPVYTSWKNKGLQQIKKWNKSTNYLKFNCCCDCVWMAKHHQLKPSDNYACLH
jgi:hypothetical protein